MIDYYSITARGGDLRYLLEYVDKTGRALWLKQLTPRLNTSNANEAIKFDNRREAERFARDNALPSYYNVTEHMWVS